MSALSVLCRATYEVASPDDCLDKVRVNVGLGDDMKTFNVPVILLCKGSEYFDKAVSHIFHIAFCLPSTTYHLPLNLTTSTDTLQPQALAPFRSPAQAPLLPRGQADPIPNLHRLPRRRQASPSQTSRDRHIIFLLRLSLRSLQVRIEIGGCQIEWDGMTWS
jgi:hypothetical protein